MRLYGATSDLSQNPIPRGVPSTEHLAELLEGDILRRGLREGDRYWTAVEAAGFLDVSRATADRAMAELAQRGVLVRRRARGTFVGPAIGDRRDPARRRCAIVHVVSANQSDERSAPRSGAIIEGLRGAIPGVSVQFSFLPWEAGEQPARDLVERISASDDWSGIVASGCSRAVYRCFAESRIPTVVLGSIYQGDMPLASVDIDNGQAARQLTQYLIDRGHRRLALFAEGGNRPGDHHFLDGMHRIMGDAGFRPDALVVRFSGNDPLPPKLSVQETLGGESPPTGIVTRSLRVAEKIASIAKERGLRLGTDVEITVQRFHGDHYDVEYAFPSAVSSVSDVDAAGQVGRMLVRISENRPLLPERLVLPTEFIPPRNGMARAPHWHGDKDHGRPTEPLIRNNA